MVYSNIAVQTTDSISEITLNCPEKRNPLSSSMIAELTGAFEEVAESDSLGIILGARGTAFSTGHDISEMLDRQLIDMRTLIQACSQLMQLIHNIPQPVVAKVQAPAIGAGCQLALSCDMVVASEKAFFQTAGGSGGWFCFTPMVAVTRAVGRKRALEMLMVGDPISAEQASEWGMINRVVPAAKLDEETRDLITRATRGSPLMKGIGKQAFYSQIELDETRAYAYATELMASTGVMEHPQERLKAFAEKRTPIFNNKRGA